MATDAVRVSEIAERIGALITGRYGERVRDAAAALGLEEGELASLLKGAGPATASRHILAHHLALVVRHFGVDPSWLVIGRYDERSHAVAEEQRGDLIALRFQLRRLLAGPDRSVEIERIERADLPAAAPDARLPAESSEAPSTPSETQPQPLTGRRGGEEPER